MKRVLLALALVTALGAGCSQTTIKREWKDPGYRGPAVKSLVVLCLPPGTLEKECEDAFISELKARGIGAESGHSAIAAASSRDNALAKARADGVSRLLVSRFLQRTTKVEIYPRGDEMMWWDYDMWGSYDYVENQYQLFATVLYDVATGKPIWSAESETFVRPSEKKTLKSYAKAMIKKMEHQGLLHK